jgi:hypothetical protein
MVFGWTPAHRVSADQNVVGVQMSFHRWAEGFTVPHRLHGARTTVVAIPQEVRDATSDLHTGESVVQFRVVNEVGNAVVMEHGIAKPIVLFRPRTHREGTIIVK